MGIFMFLLEVLDYEGCVEEVDVFFEKLFIEYEDVILCYMFMVVIVMFEWYNNFRRFF